jgi:hypothetical protein
LIILFLLTFYNEASFSDPQDIKILFVGDVMLDELPGQYIEEDKNPFSSFDPLFKNVDIAI